MKVKRKNRRAWVPEVWAQLRAPFSAAFPLAALLDRAALSPTPEALRALAFFWLLAPAASPARRLAVLRAAAALPDARYPQP